MKTSALKLSDDVFIMQTNVGVLTFMSMIDIIFSGIEHILYIYFMPVCSIVKTITPRCRGRPDALLHEAEGRVQ